MDPTETIAHVAPSTLLQNMFHQAKLTMSNNCIIKSKQVMQERTHNLLESSGWGHIGHQTTSLPSGLGRFSPSHA